LAGKWPPCSCRGKPCSNDENTRNGCALWHTKIIRADRPERLLLTSTLAYLLLVGPGLVAQRRCQPSMWCRNNDPRLFSDFTIDHIMLTRMKFKLATAVAAGTRAMARQRETGMSQDSGPLPSDGRCPIYVSQDQQSDTQPMNGVGQRIRQLGQEKGFLLRELAPMVGVGFTYLSKVKTEQPDLGYYLSGALVHKLAKAPKVGEDELLLLAE